MNEPSVEQQRILVVDDEEYLTDLLSTSLRFQGFEVETAANGLEALSKTGSFEPELIVLDVKMPDIDGLEVSRRLRAGGNNVPVIFLTARDTKADRNSRNTWIPRHTTTHRNRQRVVQVPPSDTSVSTRLVFGRSARGLFADVNVLQCRTCLKLGYAR